MTVLTLDKDTNIILLKTLVYNIMGHNLLADLTVVQGILEGALNREPPSELALKYNNLFGIKGIGTAGYILLPTHEYTHDGWIEVDQRFARNLCIEDSIRQHQSLLELPRYADLNGATTFEEIAGCVREDGYATDPQYTQELIDVYDEYVR